MSLTLHHTHTHSHTLLHTHSVSHTHSHTLFLPLTPHFYKACELYETLLDLIIQFGSLPGKLSTGIDRTSEIKKKWTLPGNVSEILSAHVTVGGG